MGRRRRLLTGGWAALLTVGAAQGQGTAPTTVELILDASGSMFSRLPDGSTRIVAAKAVLSDFISRLPDTRA